MTPGWTPDWSPEEQRKRARNGKVNIGNTIHIGSPFLSRIL